MNTSVPSVPRAYLFSMLSLLFGLPLLTAYYNVDSAYYFELLIPYVLVSMGVTLLILVRPFGEGSARESRRSDVIDRLNPVPTNVIMLLVSATVVLLGIERYLIFQSYPYPPLEVASTVGALYIVLLIATSVLGFTRLLNGGVPILRSVLKEGFYAKMAVVLSLAFALVYLLLVSQILVGGFNVQANLPPPIGAGYPFAYVFTVGIEQPFLNLVYLPYALVQLTPQVNLLVIPFEIVFATLLSLLVASNVVLSHYLISRSGLRCSTTGTAMSAFGSIVGLTATCPTCLVPTFVSVVFGGLTAAETIYSNVYGAVLPPVLSILTLLLSLLYLTRTIRHRGLDPESEFGGHPCSPQKAYKTY